MNKNRSTLGARCLRWQRVPGAGRRVLRCRKFRFPVPQGLPPGARPRNFGASCLRMQRVYSPWYNKQVWRCARYGRGAGFVRRTFPPAAPPQRIQFRPRAPAPSGAGYIPLSLPSMEKQSEGRTALYKERWFR